MALQSTPPRQSMLVLGGSSLYMLLLFKAMSAAGLWDALQRVTLFGRSAERLAFLARAGAEVAGACQVDFATDYASCVEQDYDIVFNQIRFGGLEKRDLDERTAIACGFAADETLGIVGVSNALRTISGMAPFLAPLIGRAHQPRWINFTNPCSIVTQHLVNTLGPRSAIGICDYPAVFRNKIADHFKLGAERVEIGYFGLNHFAFVYEVRVDGRQRLEQLLAGGFALAIGAQRWLDYLVVPSWNMVFDPARLHARQSAERNRAGTLLDIERDCERLLAAGAGAERLLALLAQRDCAWYELAVVPLLALCLGRRPGEAIVNLATGDVFDLGLEHCVVEANAMVDAAGARALALPQALRRSVLFDYCRAMKRAETTLLAGICSGDGRAVLRACLANPMIASAPRSALYFERLAALDPAIALFFAGLPLGAGASTSPESIPCSL
ncbi:hypothetical protein [Massilia sp. TSP1-1-2]|uniref:family 4 glycosyl hydrolase n=1 Tax=Massilia sp. TSP1-1-2 TaxID=2804649 RepID=UPI003CE736C2